MSPSRHRTWHTLARALSPVLGSLTFHAALALVLITAALSVRTLDAPAGSPEGVEITFQSPPAVPDPPARTQPAATDAPAAPAPAPPQAPAMPSRLPDAAAGPGATFESRLAAPPPAPALAAPPPAAVSFAGLDSDRAIAVVYVVDASGAMVSSIDWVLRELEHSVAALTPAQRFQVVLFAHRPDGSRLTLFPHAGGSSSLAPATDDNKRALTDWLRTVQPGGLSNPSDGLRRALAFRPDVVFLLARSIPRSGQGAQWGLGRDAILEELDRLNPVLPRLGRRRTLIKTIQFVEEDPTGTMQEIGRRHGGTDGYTLLTIKDLQR